MRNEKWAKSTSLARLLAVLMAYILVSANSSPFQKEEEESAKDLGNDMKASILASEVLKNMDPSIDPCENFYRYACGGFIKSTVIPDDQNDVDMIAIVKEKLNGQLRRVIEAESKSDELKSYRLVKKMYRSCMNTAAIEAKGLKPLHAILRKLGGWPVVDGDSWSKDDFSWINSIHKLRQIGYNLDSFITLKIGLDLKNTSRRIIDLNPATLRKDRKFLLNGFGDEKVPAYYSFMLDIAVLLGAQEERAMNELMDSLMFETRLINISSLLGAHDAKSYYNPMTLEALMKNFSSIPWKEFFNGVLPSSVTIGENDIVNVNTPAYIAALEKLIARTPKRVQANYAIWNAVADFIPYLNNEMRERKLAYLTAVSGRTQYPLRWKECIEAIPSSLSFSIHAMSARQRFNKDVKDDVIDMTTGIRKEFARMLMETDWMDEKTRNTALEKILSMTSHIGYPDELLNDDKLDELLKSYELSEESYFDNYLNATRFSMESAFSRLHEPYNKSYWLQNAEAPIVNAFYSTLENAIHITGGILQEAFFNIDRPKYMNYGAIGSIIGHEIMHGFDNLGVQFDKNGNLFDWWDPMTRENYDKRKSCIVDQYSNYTVTEVQLKLSGMITQDENIADNGGIKAAYRAYNDWVARNGAEQMLPGINLTPQQMFWISSANVGCSKKRPEALKEQIITNAHVPREFRVLGSLSNMPEFARDFKCPVGSKMNPTNKCSLW